MFEPFTRFFALSRRCPHTVYPDTPPPQQATPEIRRPSPEIADMPFGYAAIQRTTQMNSPHNGGVIRRMHRCGGLLVVQLEEDRRRTEHLNGRLNALCAHGGRFTDCGHKLVRYTLGRDYSAPFDRVQVES